MGDIQKHADELYFAELRDGWNAFRKAFQTGIKAFGRKIRQYRLVLLLLALVLFTRGAYRFLKQEPVFRATASYIYTDLHPKVYGEMTDKLQEAIRLNSYATLSRELDMPRDQLKTIKDMQAQNIFGSKLSENRKADEHIPFYIVVVAGRNTLFDTLQQKMEDYFNHNILVKQRIQKKKKILEEKIAYSKSQLILLDSLKIAYNHSLGARNVQRYPAAGQAFNPVDIYNKSIEINNNLADMEAELPGMKAVRLLNGFTVAEHPEQIPLIVFLAKALLYFALIGAGFIFLQSIFKK